MYILFFIFILTPLELYINLNMNTPFLHLELDFAAIEFYDTYVVCKIKTGVFIGIDEVVILHKKYREHYGTKRYGYIFDRTTDYTINPLTYMDCEYYPDVTAFAIVAPTLQTKRIVEFEEKFSKMKLNTFNSLDEAKKWMKEIVD